MISVIRYFFSHHKLNSLMRTLTVILSLVVYTLLIAVAYFFFVSCVCIDHNLVDIFIFVYLQRRSTNSPYFRALLPVEPAWITRSKYIKSYVSNDENYFNTYIFLQNSVKWSLSSYETLNCKQFHLWISCVLTVVFQITLIFCLCCNANYGIKR